MKRFALIVIIIGLTACRSATPGTPRPGVTPEGDTYASGGLGLSQQEWEKTHKQSSAEKSGFTKYDKDKYWILFMDNKVWSLDRDYEGDEPILDKARQEGKLLIPKDARLVKSFSPDGFPELTVDLYLSESLKARFDSNVWHDDEPGTFMVIYGVYDKKVGNFTIGTGNDYNDESSSNTRATSSASDSPIAVVTTDALNVRAGPGADYARIGEVKKGDRLDVVAKDSTAGWLLICCVNQREGWIFAGYVDVEGSLASVPVEEPDVTPSPRGEGTPPPTAPKKSSPTAPRATTTRAPVVTDTPAPATSDSCHPSYPDVCIAPPPPDLNCDDITFRNFKVVPPDPHKFDTDKDGIGCETT